MTKKQLKKHMKWNSNQLKFYKKPKFNKHTIETILAEEEEYNND